MSEKTRDKKPQRKKVGEKSQVEKLQRKKAGKKISDGRFDDFLRILKSGHTVDNACDLADISPAVVYCKRRSSPDFDRRFQRSLEQRVRKQRYNGRTTKLTTAMENKLLRLLSRNGGIVTDACKDLKISRMAVYNWKKQDPDFAAKFAEAVDAGVDVLEDEAKRRALDGVEEPVYYQGEVCGYVRRKSDGLMIFLLKGHRRKYLDRHEVSGPDGKPVESRVYTLIPDNGRDDNGAADGGSGS